MIYIHYSNLGGYKFMTDLKLESGEKIICRVRDAAISDGNTINSLDSIFLTNKHLVSVHEKSLALFSKDKFVVEKKSLDLISDYNGEIQVSVVKDDEFDVALHIFFNDGTDYLYSLGEDVPKSVYLQWENAIKRAVIENRRNVPLKAEDNNGNAESTHSVTAREKATEANESINVPNVKFCPKCGTKNNNEANFCQSCGSPIQVINNSQKVEKSVEVPQNSDPTYSERKQEYAGKIIKCPSCGEIWDAFILKCPTCGYELRGARSNQALSELFAKLETIDLQPDNNVRLKKHNNSNEITEKEKQKIALIRNFPIPNTREDLYEFLIMASSNIDTEHIEGVNDSSLSEGDKAISEAWRAKYEQAYHKANISFGQLPEFQELNIKFTNKINKHEHKKNMYRKGMAIFIVVYIIASILGMSYMMVDTSRKQKIVDAENERLELLLEDIQECIQDGDFSKARALCTALTFNVSVSLQSERDAKKHWNEVREELISTIEDAEKN